MLAAEAWPPFPASLRRMVRFGLVGPKARDTDLRGRVRRLRHRAGTRCWVCLVCEYGSYDFLVRGNRSVSDRIINTRRPNQPTCLLRRSPNAHASYGGERQKFCPVPSPLKSA